MEKLGQESQKLGAALYQQQGAEGAAPPGADSTAAGEQADDVVDAEIVDEDKDKK